MCLTIPYDKNGTIFDVRPYPIQEIFGPVGLWIDVFQLMQRIQSSKRTREVMLGPRLVLLFEVFWVPKCKCAHIDGGIFLLAALLFLSFFVCFLTYFKLLSTVRVVCLYSNANGIRCSCTSERTLSFKCLPLHEDLRKRPFLFLRYCLDDQRFTF